MTKWMIPCNVKNFNIVEHFKSEKTAFFKRNRALAVGDEVYIYVAKPFSEVKYKGHVIKTGIPANEIDIKYGVPRGEEKSFIEVELDKVFPEGTFTGKELSVEKQKNIFLQSKTNYKYARYIDGGN